jgi:hypothetical protein
MAFRYVLHRGGEDIAALGLQRLVVIAYLDPYCEHHRVLAVFKSEMAGGR